MGECERLRVGESRSGGSAEWQWMGTRHDGRIDRAVSLPLRGHGCLRASFHHRHHFSLLLIIVISMVAVVLVVLFFITRKRKKE